MELVEYIHTCVIQTNIFSNIEADPQHSGAVVSTVASQEEGPGLDSGSGRSGPNGISVRKWVDGPEPLRLNWVS